MTIPIEELVSRRWMMVRLAVLFAAAMFFINTHSVSADSFSPGRIIDDSIFTNQNSMSVSDIQAFLNSKVSSCDTNGTQPASDYGRSDLTHAQYAANKGWPAPPYTCLKDYVDSGVSSAQLIYNTAQTYQINPQILIVLLQKEQGLVTDTWPLPSQYKSATGYGCPDTASCDSRYYGLTNQLTWSGKMFRAIMNASSNWSTPYILGNNFIQYSPNASCSGTTVNIQNRSTQALYNYTPYQPNAAALAAPLGRSGDSCSSYGNINFYRYFNSWFGSTYVTNIPGCVAATNTNVSCVWDYTTPLNANVYTTSYTELTASVQNGAQYQNNYFLGINPIAPDIGNVPVYKLLDSNNSTFLTTDANERSTLISGGYTDQGIGFYADPSGSNSGYPVSRLYNSSVNIHIWTIDSTYKQTLLNSGYVDEGIAFTSVSGVRRETAPPSGKQLIYRFHIPQTKSHLWTNSVWERDTLIKLGYRYEGVSWYGSSSTSDSPIYRLFSKLTGEHLFTLDQYERSQLIATGAWVDEGIGQYASTTGLGSPVYRMYAPSIKRHFLTSDSNERSKLINGGVWKDEGIAWSQP